MCYRRGVAKSQTSSTDLALQPAPARDSKETSKETYTKIPKETPNEI